MKHNHVPFKADPDFRDFIFEIQQARIKEGIYKTPLTFTQLTRIAWGVLKSDKNKSLMLRNRVPR